MRLFYKSIILAFGLCAFAKHILAGTWTDTGKYPRYWFGHSIIYARVESLSPPGTDHADAMIRIHPLGTFGGPLDPGMAASISFHFYLEYAFPPKPNDMLLSLIRQDRFYDGDVYGQGNNAEFMPSNVNTLQVLKEGLADQRIAKTFEKVIDLRKDEKPFPRTGFPFERPRKDPTPNYWETHSLVYGTVRSIWDESSEKQTIALNFRPLLKLSGPFDPSLMPKISLSGDAKFLKPPFNQNPTGTVLLLVIGQDKKFRLASELADFMPGDHSPVCTVKDFSDSKVLDTLKAVQALRERVESCRTYTRFRKRPLARQTRRPEIEQKKGAFRMSPFCLCPSK